MENSHCTDDEEFYIPFLASSSYWKRQPVGSISTSEVRPHYGKGMDGKHPLARLRQLGYDLPEEFALFPPLLLDAVSVDWAAQGGNDLLAHYNR